MNVINRFRESLSNFIKPTATNSGLSLARKFLRGGAKNNLYGDWSDIKMKEEDLYKGYSYAAIRTRANTVARVAMTNVFTDAKQEIVDKEEIPEHPYLRFIDESKTFSNNEFWRDISTYLDLEGVYYLLALRNFTDDNGRVGDIQEFKLLNPYDIRRVLNQENMEVGGYIEQRGGLVRELPAQMIIEIRELNPFNKQNPFSMSDASKDSQFSLRTMNDYTNHSLKNNINAPGIVTSDIIMEKPDFDNFVTKVKERERGLPLFGNGSGAIKWQDMQTDLNRSALSKVHEVSREQLIAVSGVSKTILGIEQSGVTRDSTKVQKDLNIENHILPRIELILEALNQDFKNNYTAEYERTKFVLKVENPTSTDYEAIKKSTEVRKSELDIFNLMIERGYDEEKAGKFASGEISIDEIGEPANIPSREGGATQSHICPSDCLPTVLNQFTEEQQGLVNQQQAALKNAVINVERNLVASSLIKITKNQFEEENDVVYKKDKTEAVSDLNGVLKSFYGIVFTIEGGRIMTKRSNEISLGGSFSIDRVTKQWIKDMANKVAKHHVETVLDDILIEARKLALEGATQPEIVTGIKNKFTAKISKQRAETIARTETNRAFTQAQFEADSQFIKQNNLEGRAFKKWVTRSDNPCPYCESLASEPPIPFDQAFRKLGSEVEVTEVVDGDTITRSLPVNFTELEAGNAHPNCACIYQLIVEPELL